MPLVAPVILPEMYKIFTMAEVYGIRTRARAVEIFTTCAHMICNMEELEKVREPLDHVVLPTCGSGCSTTAHSADAPIGWGMLTTQGP